jgi:hypothetical protein
MKNEKVTLNSKRAHSKLILALAVIMAFIMAGGGIVSIWMLVHYFGGKTKLLPFHI